jgi:hypothetical protein
MGDWVGFSTPPKDLLRALKRCKTPRWQHIDIAKENNVVRAEPIPHKYRHLAQEYAQARQLIA